MTDYEALQNVKASYCRAVDALPDDRAHAMADLRSLMMDAVVADYGSGAINGAEDVIQFLAEQIVGGSEWMLHMVHSPCITVTDAAAEGLWTVQVQMKRRGTGALDSVIGRYADQFCRQDGLWKFARIEFRRCE
ncbi:nuclear transport factor 2 family protein [Novosphingopyxis baekryungensis]|uniref:nuclear transport factor 2 family protein n=1 Tax=Novosphingopyxis baekryungensis TaxID=279369 RepID=UPI0003B3923D|nr:nuclear transport factor 2 family protein [Novosphingopyxis baekryungensis]